MQTESFSLWLRVTLGLRRIDGRWLVTHKSLPAPRDLAWRLQVRRARQTIAPDLAPGQRKRSPTSPLSFCPVETPITRSRDGGNTGGDQWRRRFTVKATTHTRSELIHMSSQLLAARAAALFASDLPAGSRPSALVVDTAIAGAVRRCGGTRGCVAHMAAAYGDYPETAAPRMRWARGVVETTYRARRLEPDRELIAA
jgi:hypothetical protein